MKPFYVKSLKNEGWLSKGDVLRVTRMKSGIYEMQNVISGMIYHLDSIIDCRRFRCVSKWAAFIKRITG